MPTALVIGASRGLGRGLADELHGRGWEVVATVRDLAALPPRDRLEVERLDVTDPAGAGALARRLEGRRLDLLFVNAGIAGDKRSPAGRADPRGWVEVMEVNALAPVRLIEELDALVPAGGTVAAMSSDLGSIARATSGGWASYRMSKAALNMGLRTCAARDGRGRTWLAVAPGWVRTDMGGPGASLSVEQSVRGIADTLAARAGSGGCRFVNWRGEEVPW